MKKSLLITALMVLSLLSPSTFAANVKVPPAGALDDSPIAVTQPFYAEWVQQVGGDRVDVCLIDKTTNEGLADVDYLYETGLGVEPWLDSVVSALNPEVRRQVLTDGIPTLQRGSAFWMQMEPPQPSPSELPSCCRKDAADSNTAWAELVSQVPLPKTVEVTESKASSVDPNVWFSVANAMTAIVSINEGLAELDPAHADYYDRNAAAYLEELAALNDWIQSKVREIPAGKRLLVSDGDSFRYFAQAYGFVAPVYTPMYEGLVFVEQLSGSSQAKEGDTLLLPGRTTALTYVQLMRDNTRVIVEGLEK